MAWPRGHATTLATPRRCWCLRQGVCQGWREPSIRRHLWDGGPTGSGCTPARPPPPLPHPPVLLSGRPLPWRSAPLFVFCCGDTGVSAQSVPFSLALHLRLCLLSLCAPASTLSLPVPLFLCGHSPRCPLLVLLSLGRNVGTLSQTLEGHAGASGLTALTSCGIARQRGPVFVSGVDCSKRQLYWCRCVSSRCRPLLLRPLSPLNCDQLVRRTGLAISVFDSLYS